MTEQQREALSRIKATKAYIENAEVSLASYNKEDMDVVIQYVEERDYVMNLILSNIEVLLNTDAGCQPVVMEILEECKKALEEFA